MKLIKNFLPLSIVVALLGCSSSPDLTRKGAVEWSYSYADQGYAFNFRCVSATSGSCRTEFIDSSGKVLKVVTVDAGKSVDLDLSFGAAYFLVSPDEGLSILARTNKIQRAQVSGAQEFNKDHV